MKRVKLSNPTRTRFCFSLLMALSLVGPACKEPHPDPDPIPDPQPGSPAQLIYNTAAQNQSAPVNAAVAISPSVQVVDAAGRGVPGVTVTFAVQSGGGTVSGGVQTTDGGGNAAVGLWRMGPAPGPNSLAVQVNGLQPFVFNATATPPPTGSLAVTVTGLPAGVAALVAVTGANGYAADLNGSTTLSALPVGTYVITAQSVQQGTTRYNPAPTTQNVSVAAGGTTQASVGYTVAPPINLVLDGALFFQTVQTAQGTIPMMANKPAIVRVWVHATQANAYRVPVRLRIYRGSQLLHDARVFGPTTVPTQYQVADATASWNFLVPYTVMQTGISASVQVDPDNTVPEVSENDNAYPASGSAPVAVLEVPPFRIRFIRVCTAYPPYACGQLADPDEMLQTLYSVWPVWQREIVAGYQWNTYRDVSNNGGWDALLQDMAALRVADGYGGSGVHYLGILTSPPGTWDGLALIGGFAGLAKYDNPTVGRTIIAHEMGHNFGRKHAPCGGPADPDPYYPTPDASVGIYGIDLFTGQVTTPVFKDIMSYCPPYMSVSEYTYMGVLAARRGPFPSPAPAATRAQPILVVAGRLVDGVLTLDPVFDATAPPVVPSGRGRFLLEGVDEAGRTLFSYRFTPTEVGHTGGEGEIFAFGIPISPEARAQLYELRLSGGGRRVIRRGTRMPLPSRSASGEQRGDVDAVTISREGNGVLVRWDASRYEALSLKETRTGRLIAFLRNGSGHAVTTESEFEVQLSDGVQTVRGPVTAH